MCLRAYTYLLALTVPCIQIAQVYILPVSVTRSCVSSTGLTGSYDRPTHTYVHAHACIKHTYIQPSQLKSWPTMYNTVHVSYS